MQSLQPHTALEAVCRLLLAAYRSKQRLDSMQSQQRRLTGCKMPLSPFKMLMDLLLPRLSLSIDMTSCRWRNIAGMAVKRLCYQAALLCRPLP